jgi:hypothetical protein
MSGLELMACFLSDSHIAVARESVAGGGYVHAPGDVALGSPTASDHLSRPRHLPVSAPGSSELTDVIMLCIPTWNRPCHVARVGTFNLSKLARIAFWWIY